MKFISCKEEYLTSRYRYLVDNMKGGARLHIFKIRDWDEPYNFGRENKGEATKIYDEAMRCIFEEEVDDIADDEYCDYIIMALKTSNGEVGILWISEDEYIFLEHVEDLFNALVNSTPIKKPVELESVPSIKKPDNLVINKMHLFKNV